MAVFGDACGAVVIEASESETGMIASRIGCESDAKYAIQITNVGWGSIPLSTTSFITLGILKVGSFQTCC